jgi:hypothetical protein
MTSAYDQWGKSRINGIRAANSGCVLLSKERRFETADQ